MIPLTIITNMEQHPWKDLLDLPPDKYISKDELGLVNRIGRLPRGTKEGNSTVCIQITMSDGRTVVGETTLKLLAMAFSAMKAAAEMEGEII